MDELTLAGVVLLLLLLVFGLVKAVIILVVAACVSLIIYILSYEQADRVFYQLSRALAAV